jgi:hypothetical protein
MRLRAVGAPIVSAETTAIHHHGPTFNSMED